MLTGRRVIVVAQSGQESVIRSPISVAVADSSQSPSAGLSCPQTEQNSVAFVRVEEFIIGV
ncbi:hypothetical protein JCM18549_22430 [Halolamina salina]